MDASRHSISRQTALLVGLLAAVLVGGALVLSGGLSGDDVAAAPTTPLVDGPTGPGTRSASAISEQLAGATDATATSAPASGSTEVPKHAPQAARSDADTVLAQMEACFATTRNYARCDERAELGRTGLRLVTGRDPRPGQVSVKGRGDRLLIRAADSVGQLWQITKSADAPDEADRVCMLADGSGPCRTATW